MNADRPRPITAGLQLLLFWTLFTFTQTSTGIHGDYNSLAACEAMGQKKVEWADAQRAEFVAAKAAKLRSDPDIGVFSTVDYNLHWECKPSDGSTSTYGGYGITKPKRPQP
jgi:hypothetical protein